jgi:hypothetical protein
MALWLPKWLRADAPPEPQDPNRRTFLMGAAAVAAAALLPSSLPPGWNDKLFSAQQLLNEPNTLLAMYRSRSLYGKVVLDRMDMMLAAEHGPGAFWQYAQEETARALAEVEAEARRAGIKLEPYDPDRFTESVVTCSGGYATAQGREVIVPIALHEVPRWEDNEGNVLRQVRVPTHTLVPQVRIPREDS